MVVPVMKMQIQNTHVEEFEEYDDDALVLQSLEETEMLLKNREKLKAIVASVGKVVQRTNNEAFPVKQNVVVEQSGVVEEKAEYFAVERESTTVE